MPISKSGYGNAAFAYEENRISCMLCAFLFHYEYENYIEQILNCISQMTINLIQIKINIYYLQSAIIKIVGSTGSHNLKVTVPDSFTNWFYWEKERLVAVWSVVAGKCGGA